MFWYLTRWFRMSKWQLIGATAFWVAVAICCGVVFQYAPCGLVFVPLAAIFGSILAYKVIRDQLIKRQTATVYQQPPQVMGPPRTSQQSSSFAVPPRHPDDRS